jgi:hypothetical protein
MTGGSSPRQGRSEQDRERVTMRVNPFLEFLRAFFAFLLALLGRGGPAA